MDRGRKEALISALAHPRFEVVPLAGLAAQAAYLPPRATVTVTCSATRGIGPTLQHAEQLMAPGRTVVPHIAARLLRGETELGEVLRHLAALDLQDIFVIGGDVARPRGPYLSALDVLRALCDSPFRPARIGVAAYPEFHPLIGRETLERALWEKQAFADYLVTQICFDPATTVRWLRGVRQRGIHLPAYIGLPGALDTAQLLRISLKIGVGDSVRFLSRQSGLAGRLLSLGGYRPDALLEGLAPDLDDPTLGIAGLHLNTFNQIESTERWRRETLRRWGGNGSPGKAAV